MQKNAGKAKGALKRAKLNYFFFKADTKFTPQWHIE